ncbi:MAG TPA: 4Fe-4S dicluster domain-containing protein, partial [Candidatus Sulfomarinibacteraceae bacterium]|nr:4Fe-4S dicluster domain-containing protein [Candidatus Sulfomarinibacteraceae bacterium]
MTRHGLDVVVKLNPTLLGFDRVGAILAGELGYEEIRLRRSAFEADLSFARAVELIRDLDGFAQEHGRRFGIKLTNTLVVENHRGFLPDDPMYLSGPPLHVLSTTLLGELDRALPGRLAVDGHPGTVAASFSAGVTKHNLPRVAGLGLAPITACTDLLKPGGYGRLKPMLGALAEAMIAAGSADLPAWQAHERAAALAAGFAGPTAAYAAGLHDAGRNAAYTRAGTARLPRRVDHDLERWGCVACNVCVTVCPNDAFFRLPTPAGMEIAGAHQYLLFAELCNECGNCLVFCPERGDPATVKPALFLDPDRFAHGDRAGFLLALADDDGRVSVHPSHGLEADAARVSELLNAAPGLPIGPISSRPRPDGTAPDSGRGLRRRCGPDRSSGAEVDRRSEVAGRPVPTVGTDREAGGLQRRQAGQDGGDRQAGQRNELVGRGGPSDEAVG